MANVDADEDLGPWRPAELAETAEENAGIGADDDLPQDVRFISNVAKLIRRRRAEDGQESDPKIPAVFVLRATPPRSATVQTKQVPMLDNGCTQVSGRLWFVSAVVVAGHYYELTQSDDEELFRFVSEKLLLGELPAVIFDPRPKIPEIRFYPKGLREPESCQKTQLGGASPNVDSIITAIDRVYEACLVTPDAQPRAGKLWTNTRSGGPRPTPKILFKSTLRQDSPMPSLPARCATNSPCLPGVQTWKLRRASRSTAVRSQGMRFLN